MKRTGLVLWGLIALVLVFSTPICVAAAEAPIVLQHGTFAPPPPYAFSIGEVAWAKDIEKRTNGRVQIKHRWSGSISKIEEMVNLLSKGGMDIGTIVPGYYPFVLPLASGPNNCFFKNNTLDEAIYSWWAMFEEKDSPLKAEWTKGGMMPLWTHLLSTNRLWTREPVQRLKDIKGKSVRVWGPYSKYTLEAVGAVMVDIKTTDVFDALDKGVVNIVAYTYGGTAIGLQNAAKYLIETEFGNLTGAVVAMNLKKWNSLPPDIQAAIAEASKATIAPEIKIMLDTDEIGKEECRKAGVKILPFLEMDQWRAVTPDLWEVWIKDLSAKGLGDQAKWAVNAWKKKLEAMRSK